jgi:hypothetical protein
MLVGALANKDDVGRDGQIAACLRVKKVESVLRRPHVLAAGREGVSFYFSIKRGSAGMQQRADVLLIAEEFHFFYRIIDRTSPSSMRETWSPR